MGQRLIFQCLSFPFTISLCKWPTSPVPGVSNSSPKIKDDQIQNAPSLSQSPRGIYEGCTTRTQQSLLPPCPTGPTAHLTGFGLPHSHSSRLCCLSSFLSHSQQVSSSWSFILCSGNKCEYDTLLHSQHPHFRRGQRRVAAISVHSGYQRCGKDCGGGEEGMVVLAGLKFT